MAQMPPMGRQAGSQPQQRPGRLRAPPSARGRWSSLRRQVGILRIEPQATARPEPCRGP